MKSFKSLIMTGLLLAAATSSYAVKAIDNGSKFGTGEDSIRCMENVSLLNSYYKIKSYDDAYNSFKIVFDECPQAAGRTLYNNGVTLIKYKMNNEKDAAKKKEWFNLLMDCYEKRILYFGKDPKYPEAYIRGRQAIDYIELSGDKNFESKVMPWLEKSVAERGSASEPGVVDYYFRILTHQYKENPEQLKESYINSYLKIDKLLEGSIVMNEKSRDAYKQTRNNVNATFIASGAADCKTLDDVFAAKVEASKDNVIDLTTIIKLYRSAKCTESDIYFAASAAAHQLNPTSETAAGCGYQAIKKEK